MIGFIEVIIAIVVFLIWVCIQDDTKPCTRSKKKVSFAETRSEIFYDKKTGDVIGSACAPT